MWRKLGPNTAEANRWQKQQKEHEDRRAQQEQHSIPLRLLVATSSSSATSAYKSMLATAGQSGRSFQKDKVWLHALSKHFFRRHATGCAAAVVVHGCRVYTSGSVLPFFSPLSLQAPCAMYRPAQQDQMCITFALTVLGPGAWGSAGRRQSGSPCPSSPGTWPHRPQPCN